METYCKLLNKRQDYYIIASNFFKDYVGAPADGEKVATVWMKSSLSITLFLLFMLEMIKFS